MVQAAKVHDTPEAVEALEVLKACFLFNGVPDELLASLLSYFETRTCLASDPIFLEQESSDHVYLVRRGSVEIVKYSNQIGRLQRIVVVGSGESFSELSLLTQSNHSTSAFALEDTELLQLDRKIFLKILQKHPRVGSNLLRSLARLNQQVLQDKDHVDSYQNGFLQPHPQLSKLVPFSMVEHYQVIPLRFQKGVLLVGMRDPDNLAFFKIFRQQNPDINLKVCTITEKDFQQLKKSISTLYTSHGLMLQFERKNEGEKRAKEDDGTPIAVLQRSKNFQFFNSDILEKIAHFSEILNLKAGDLLYDAGQRSEFLYIIIQGEVELRAPKSHGGSRLVAHRATGALLGENSLILESPHSMTARASRESQVMRLPRNYFDQLLDQPIFLLGIAQGLAKRLQRSNYLTRYRQDQKIVFEHLPTLSGLIPHHILRRHRIVPLEINDRVLTIGSASPDSEGLFSILQRYVSQFRIELISISDTTFHECMQAMLRSSVERPSAPLQVASVDTIRTMVDVNREIESLVLTASRMRASDIHLEMQKEGMIFRFRIDGLLQEALEKVSVEAGRQILNRLKILAKLDIAESRIPQDGQIMLDTIPGTALAAMRLSLVPTVFGEKAVLRLHRGDMALLPLELLTPNRHIAMKLREIVEIGEGVVLVVGPTGSGKTSTLYAMLNQLNRSETNIVSVEDPVETVIPGISQIPVHEEIGRTYDTVLRHILRQDPDIIMIGEIRDHNSAQIAFEAAVTGHLVLTTLHATDSLSALPRLTELGVPMHALASGLSAIISQRLVRSICTECKTYRPITQKQKRVLERLVPHGDLPTQLAVGQGCEHCRYSGYYDRIAVFEVWQKTPRIHQRLLSSSGFPDIVHEIHAEGFQPLMNTGLQLVLNGLTTLEEVIQNCPVPPLVVRET